MKGATDADIEIDAILGISIHAPMKGATKLIIMLTLIKIFQSTLP